MERFITEFAGYGPVTLMVAFMLYLLRDRISDVFKGHSNDTTKLIAALEQNSKDMRAFAEGLNHMAEQFQHNNVMFTAVTGTAKDMLYVLREIHTETVRGRDR